MTTSFAWIRRVSLAVFVVIALSALLPVVALAHEPRVTWQSPRSGKRNQR